MKKLEVLTFMSWENEGSVWNKETRKYDSDKVRAIALCDPSGYFLKAINCLRDGDMGEKDENGVYERSWWADYIDCYGNERETLRPATGEEIELYKKYCPIIDSYLLPYKYVFAELTDEGGTHIIYADRCKLSRMVREFISSVYYSLIGIKSKMRLLMYKWRHRNDKPDEKTKKHIEDFEKFINEAIEGE